MARAQRKAQMNQRRELQRCVHLGFERELELGQPEVQDESGIDATK